MISGKYLGEILRQAVVAAIAKGLILNGRVCCCYCCCCYVVVFVVVISLQIDDTPHM
jgi:hypothetical protein